MVRIRLHPLVLIALFLSLSCIVVHAEGWVERSDVPCSGGVYEDPGYNFYRYSIGESDPSAHIVINEIEQNPYGTDAGNEWVELYNPTTSDVNLDGWKLSTTHGITVTVTLCGTIPANGYFVYTHTEQWLDNEDESVTLRDPSLNEIDRTPYLTEPYRIDNGYYSWQRYPNGKDTDSDSDWEFRASTKGYGSGGEMPPPKTIYVDDDFVDDPPNHKWNTIQEGVNDASNDDTIIVRDGIYRENVDVYKRLTIHSENGADATIVQAASVYDHVFYVIADYVNISGFTVTGATKTFGIYLSNANHCSISNNNASNNDCNIYLYSSSNNTLENNTATDSNTYDGIVLSSSSCNTLKNNNASDNSRIGIGIWNSNNNILQNSTANSNNLYGIYFQSSSNYNTLESNTANSNGGHGICIGSSSNNTLLNNNVSNNIDGICLSNSNDNIIRNNTANSNDYGIWLSYSSNNNITCNWVYNNTQRGFYLRSESTDNNINYNNIIENGNYNTTSGGWKWQFYNDQSTPVEAKHNYWGAGMNSSTIDASIYDNEEGRGEVGFCPFETDPVQCAPISKPPAFTTADAVIALEIAVGSREYDRAMDVNDDGQVSSVDVLMILQATVGCIEIG